MPPSALDQYTPVDETTCEGGELVLYELGLVVLTQNGDSVTFTSGTISHFNMPFRGYRASIVCHSDRHSDAWTSFRNHWTDYALFRSSYATLFLHIISWSSPRVSFLRLTFVILSVS